MKKTVFTDTMIRKLKPKGSDYTRSEGNGFTIRVLPSGVKTWLYLYVFDGKRRKMNLGHYPDVDLSTARSKFEDAKRKMKNGIDPLAELEAIKRDRVLAPTVAKLIEEYIEKHAKKNKKSWREDERCLEKDVLPVWGKQKARDITKRDVVLLLEGIVDRGSPVMANNTFEKIRKMFNFAVERDILQFTPCYGVKPPTKREPKDRVMSDEEIRIFWHGLDNAAMSEEIRRALKLILLTAQRPGEVIGMDSDEISETWWTIPAVRAKNGKTHRVFLSSTARGLIGDKSGYIFESPVTGLLMDNGKPRPPQPMDVNAIAYAVRRSLKWPKRDNKGKQLRTDDGEPATCNLIGVDNWTPHDLRRTAATKISELGFSDEIIDAILNHVKKGVVAVYNRHKYDREKQLALEAWDLKLQQIISGKAKANVTSIGAVKNARAVA